MGKQTVLDRLKLKRILFRIRPEAEVGVDVKKRGWWAALKLKLRF